MSSWLAILWLSGAAATPADPPNLPGANTRLLDAMTEELQRNARELKLRGYESPYFISYVMKDSTQREVSARYGAVFSDDVYRDRKLGVEVRVGSYVLDNSTEDDELGFTLSAKGQSHVARKNGPVDDGPSSPAALRTALWLATDEKYKAALFNYLKKKGEEVYAMDALEGVRPPSFSREPPNQFIQAPLSFTFDSSRWTAAARALSARLSAHPELFDSEVRITGERLVRLFVSTEGSRISTEGLLYGVHVSAVTRAPDGQLLDNSRDFYAPREAGLPSDEALGKEADSLVSELLALREAPALDPYTGPAILAPEAAGVLFHEAVGHRLEGERQSSDTEGKTFKGQIGKALLPSFLTLYDDPRLRELGGRPLNGHYLFDDQGVPAQRASLVEKGVLRQYLLSRKPVEGFLRSNGHGRAQGNGKPVARMANLIVEASGAVSDAALKRRLIAEAKRQGKPYGLLIRDVTGGNTDTSSSGYQAFKGIPRMVFRVDVKDGSERLVRGVEIVGTPLSAVNRILAAGKTVGVFNGYCGAESGMVPVSAVSPAVLLQELELQRTQDGKDRPPLLERPGPSR